MKKKRMKKKSWIDNDTIKLIIVGAIMIILAVVFVIKFVWIDHM
jgi:hypothetical protein